MEYYLNMQKPEESNIFWRLYDKVFNNRPTSAMPSVVMVEADDIGPYAFAAGFWFSENTFYIQFSGILREHQGKLLPKGLIRKFCKKVHKDFGNPWFMAVIENNNLPAIKALLDTRFQIIGVRQTTEKKLLVEFLRSNNGK